MQDPVSASKVDLTDPLKRTEAHKEHYLVEWEKQRQRLLGLMDVKQLNLHKQKVSEGKTSIYGDGGGGRVPYMAREVGNEFHIWGAHKDHYLVEWEKERQRLLGLMDVKQLNLHK